MSSKKHRNLQTLSEWVEVIRLARDQGQHRYQNGESHFVKFIQILRHFIKTPYHMVHMQFSHGPSLRPSLIMEFLHDNLLRHVHHLLFNPHA